MVGPAWGDRKGLPKGTVSPSPDRDELPTDNTVRDG